MRRLGNIISSVSLCLLVACASTGFKAGETTVAEVEKEWGHAAKSIPLSDGSTEYYWVINRHTTISGGPGSSSIRPTVTWRILVFDSDGHYKREGGVKTE